MSLTRDPTPELTEAQEPCRAREPVPSYLSHRELWKPETKPLKHFRFFGKVTISISCCGLPCSSQECFPATSMETFTRLEVRFKEKDGGRCAGRA